MRFWHFVYKKPIIDHKRSTEAELIQMPNNCKASQDNSGAKLFAESQKSIIFPLNWLYVSLLKGNTSL